MNWFYKIRIFKSDATPVLNILFDPLILNYMTFS
ncbi:hypothetical protein SAMN05518672_102357 [Chitinophaga sp. CF118]|nr:hypothetical protein SAMN05518672_102357 [Chitinophaga sp. CF118]